MIAKIAWSNILHKPLGTILCISLLTFSVGIITLLLLMQDQLEQKFDRDLKDIDLVVGAKGSPLQLVLSAVYHLDAPTGNIPMVEARKLMESPVVKQAIPLAYGDSYRGFRIVGTTEDYISKYDAELANGRVFTKSMEVTVGARIAQQTGLGVGDTFLGTHGEVASGHVHDEHPYTVVGILAETNTVLDQLLLTPVESVWAVHHHEEHEHTEDGHEHEEHEHAEENAHAEETEDGHELTAILLQYKQRMASLTMPRLINEQTNMQAVLPALEINRLFYLLGIGTTTLELIAGGIMLMSGFSVFFVLYGRLRERRYELALLRSVGYAKGHLIGLLLLEGILLASIGYGLGLLLSRLGLSFINGQAAGDFHFQFQSAYILPEAWLLLITLGVGVLAALLPAIQATRIDVSRVLAES